MIKFFQVAAALVVAIASTSPALAAPAGGGVQIGVSASMNPKMRGAVTTLAIGNANTVTADTGTIRNNTRISGNVIMTTDMRHAATDLATSNTSMGNIGLVRTDTVVAGQVNATHSAPNAIVTQMVCNNYRNLIGSIGAP